MLGAIDVLAKSVCLDGLKEKKGKKYNCCFFNNKKCHKIQFAVFFYKGEDLLFFKAGPMSSSNLKAILALRFPLEIVYSPSLLTTQLTNYRWDICSYSISDNKTTAVGKSLCFELQPYWIIGNAKKKKCHPFVLLKEKLAVSNYLVYCQYFNKQSKQQDCRNFWWLPNLVIW